ncbi:NUDIX hydrolase [Marinicella meishanensis]|uniref:NUDIX hydrolase n=1 Tax=Marinicella meishanensis TaxID=2873263 RepID=UPI001CC0553E|nr:NUDIX hydrolase [Marinicella sp. NBU2979]
MAAWAVIENQEKILLIERSSSTSRPGQWCFPGGGIKFNEKPEEACVREAKEETDLDVLINELVIEIEGNHYFRCEMKHKGQAVTPNLSECDSYVWVEPEKLLETGMIMDLKFVYQVLSLMGYAVKLNDEAKQKLR